MLSEFEKLMLKGMNMLVSSNENISQEYKIQYTEEYLKLLDPKKFQTPDEKAQDDLVGTNDASTEVGE